MGTLKIKNLLISLAFLAFTASCGGGGGGGGGTTPPPAQTTNKVTVDSAQVEVSTANGENSSLLSSLLSNTVVEVPDGKVVTEGADSDTSVVLVINSLSQGGDSSLTGSCQLSGVVGGQEVYSEGDVKEGSLVFHIKNNNGTITNPLLPNDSWLYISTDFKVRITGSGTTNSAATQANVRLNPTKLELVTTRFERWPLKRNLLGNLEFVNGWPIRDTDSTSEHIVAPNLLPKRILEGAALQKFITDNNLIVDLTVNSNDIDTSTSSASVRLNSTSLTGSDVIAIGANVAPLVPTYDVTGKILDSRGNPVPNAKVTINSNPVVVHTNGSGNFTAKVPTGNHTMLAEKDGLTIVAAKPLTVSTTGATLGTVPLSISYNPVYRDFDGDGYGDPAVFQNLATSTAQPPFGYVMNSGDCNDSAINGMYQSPFLSEMVNGFDDDCDGSTDEGFPVKTWFFDADNDGYGLINITLSSTYKPNRFAQASGDCNDLDSSVNPDSSELYNLIDDDCDSSIDEGFSAWYLDGDEDGYGDAAQVTHAIAQPTGYVSDNTDCNDSQTGVNPGSTEIYNLIDDDCDGSIDEGIALNLYYRDLDGDTFGNTLDSTLGFTPPAGYVADNTDCNDTDAAIYPTAAEFPNGIDDDCDGTADEGFIPTTWYQDSDGDGFGNTAVTQSTVPQPVGYVSNGTDCNDADASVNPTATEDYNLIDDDCDGTIDEGFFPTTWYQDSDGDGFGNTTVNQSAVSQPAGYVSNDTDCNDADSSVNPLGVEILNGLDDNCDGTIDNVPGLLTWYRDADGDTFGNMLSTQLAATQPTGFVSDNTDCDDTASLIHPGGIEILNSLDDDCDGNIDEGLIIWYRDQDGDGYGNVFSTTSASVQPAGYVADNTDCDDFYNYINPSVPEAYNLYDDNCNGQIDEGFAGYHFWYADADGDGYGTGSDQASGVTPPVGYVSNAMDCYDVDASIHPGAVELLNTADDDCDGAIDETINVITDPGLTNCVSVATGFDMSPAALAAVTTLDCSLYNVGNLDGIEALTGLTDLTLMGNIYLTNTGALERLPQLLSLNLTGTQIVDIPMIGKLTNLDTLILGANPVWDLRPLATLSSLNNLVLIGDQVSDVTPLSGLNNLVTLALSNNFVTDISPLSGLTGLNNLDISNNPVASIAPVGSMTGLKFLNLSGIGFTDVTPLSSLTQMIILDLGGAPVANLAPLNPMIGLTTLHVDSNSALDLSTLGTKPTLTTLSAQVCGLTDAAVVAANLPRFTNLLDLNLHSNNLVDPTPIAAVATLSTLNLGNNLITDISSLGTMAMLTNLDVSQNSLLSLSGLQTLSILSDLNIANNKITDLAPLTNAFNLNTIDVTNNCITDFSPLNNSNPAITGQGLQANCP